MASSAQNMAEDKGFWEDNYQNMLYTTKVDLKSDI